MCFAGSGGVCVLGLLLGHARFGLLWGVGVVATGLVVSLGCDY